VLDASWLLLLIAAAGLVLGLARGPRRAAFPAALIVLAAALGWWGRLELVASTPTPPQPANTGNIMVYTSDPKTSLELSIHSASSLSGETLPGYQWLRIYVGFERADGQNLPPLWWVVALGFDAVFPPGEFPASGTIPTFFSRPYHEPGWTHVGGDKPAYFLNGVT
jgi:hypothetical protein